MTACADRVIEIGRELFAAVRARRPRAPSRAWLDERGMAWSMRDERLKIQLFRFIDASPGLIAPAQVARHLGEYLGPCAASLPWPARWAVRRLGRGGPLDRLAAGAADIGLRQLAGAFIAGSDADGILATIAGLRRDGLGFTVDVLGEAIVSEDEADAYQQRYLTLIGVLADAARRWPVDDQIDRDHAGPIPSVNVSIKLSALTSRFDGVDPAGSSRAVRERLRPILRLARSRGVFINVDMEHRASRDATLRTFRDALVEDEFRGWSDVGIAIQAYLRDAGDDVMALARWAQARGAPVWVRLVKGAYWDHERAIAAQNGWPAPVFTGKSATDASYEALTRLLIERRDVLRPAFASHNVRSIAHALALVEARGVPARQVEFQLLHGMADPLKLALAERGERVRVYAPFGDPLPGMAYLVRRLLENTSNQGFVRVGFIEHGSEEGLLMEPIASGEGPGPGVRSPESPHVQARHAGADDGVFINEAPADFSVEAVRAAMARAVKGFAPSAEVLPLVIGGRAVLTGRTLESIDPSHRSRVLGRVALAGPAEVDRAVAAAVAAFPAWRDAPWADRAALLDRVADLLRGRRWALAALLVHEAGKSWRDAEADVGEAIDFCRYYAVQARALAVPRRRDVPGEDNAMHYEGRGVAVAIAPWNFPLAILYGMTAAAVVTGNPAIMKPAEQTPLIAAELMRAFADAGAPAGVVQYLPGIGEEIGPLLTAHRDVSIIAFTGSREVGLAIHRAAAAMAEDAGEVKKVITEMGGKNAIIVDDDADLDEAVQGVVQSAFGFQGQKCSACSRAIVLDAVHDRFLDRLVAATRSLAIGPAADPGSGIGPVIDGEARARILARIADARGEARLVYAGDAGAVSDEGFYIAPHLFADVPPTSRLAQEEIFGPVLAVLRARDLDHAVAMANGTRYALTGGAYSRSPSTIARVRRDLRVGNLYINRRITGALVDRQPFGGFRLSGIGSKAGGPDYLLQFTVPRCITENTMRHGFLG